jgi:hypothetical protein
MRLQRGQHRPLEISKGRADRDPMFKALWYSGFGETAPRSPPQPIARDEALERLKPSLELLPLPPTQPEPNADTWRAALGHVAAVNAMLKDEPGLDHAVLFDTVRDLLDTYPSADAIVTAYRARMQERRK